MDIKKPKDKISLYKALDIGYTRNIDKQRKKLKKYGYVIDSELTNPREHVVAYNPEKKKLLYISQGTDTGSAKSFVNDLATDTIMGLGGLKKTKRYESEKNTLVKAREKYKPEEKNIALVGHSLGGAIVSSLAPSQSHAYTFDPAYAPGQKARENVHNYRTHGDIFSMFAPDKNTTTLANVVESSKTRPVNWLLKTHEVENAKDLPVFF